MQINNIYITTCKDILNLAYCILETCEYLFIIIRTKAREFTND